MTTSHLRSISAWTRPQLFAWCMALLASLLLSACGGGDDPATPAAPSAPATITAQPLSNSVVAGSRAVFSVVASSIGPITYLWQQAGGAGAFTDIAGATQASYITAVTALTDSGATFRVRITNAAGTVDSAAVTLVVSSVASATTGSVITTQPADTAVTASATASFSVVAAGAGPLAYDWQSSTDGGTTWASIAGANAATYTTTATTLADSGTQYQVIVSNAQGSVASAVARLTVGGPPAVASGGNSCSPFEVPAGTTVTHVLANPTTPTFAGTFAVAGRGATTFEGHNVIETDLTIPLLGSPLFTRAFTATDANGLVTAYGLITTMSAPVVNGNTTEVVTRSVATPPVADGQWALAPGQSQGTVVTTTVNTQTIFTNGVAGPPTTTTETGATDATTFVGLETVTVPAGTFRTCRYTRNNYTFWGLAGLGGQVVKDTNGSYATSITVNGAAITSN